MKKGQYLRLFLSKTDNGSLVPVAAATNMKLHVSVATENSSTKDDTGDWDVIEPVGISYDISSEALVIDDEGVDVNLNSEIDLINDSPLRFVVSATDGNQNRSRMEDICGGNVKQTSVQVTAANRQNSTVTAQFNGYAELIVSDEPVQAAPSNSSAPKTRTKPSVKSADEKK